MVKQSMQSITGHAVEADAYYVYMLYDKTNQRPFYIGKGKSDRLLQHQFDAEKLNDVMPLEDITSSKLSHILRHDVEPVMIKFGLTEEEAFYAESALINAFNYQFEQTNQPLLTNIAKGKSTKREKHLFSKDGQIKARSFENFEDNYKIENFDASTLQDECIFIKINQSYHPNDTIDDIYHHVRGVWQINAKRLPKLKYAFALFNNICVGVFAIRHWKRAYEWNNDHPFPQRKDNHEQAIVKYQNILDLMIGLPMLYSQYFSGDLAVDQQKLTNWRQSYFFEGDTNVPPQLKDAIGKRIVNIPNKSSGFKRLDNQSSILYNDIQK